MPKLTFLAFAFGALSSLPAAAAEDSYSLTWETLTQDHFVGRTRELGWGMGGIKKDLNTPIFAEVSLCPVHLYKEVNGPSRLKIGAPKHSENNLQEMECRSLGTTGSEHIGFFDSKTKKVNEKIRFSPSDIQKAAKSIVSPEFYRRLGECPFTAACPQTDQIGYVLEVHVYNDASILPFTRVGMRTYTTPVARYEMKLPPGTHIDGIDLERGYQAIGEKGPAPLEWKDGYHLGDEYINFNLGFSMKVGLQRGGAKPASVAAQPATMLPATDLHVPPSSPEPTSSPETETLHGEL
jgi:hypothetical protein